MIDQDYHLHRYLPFMAKFDHKKKHFKIYFNFYLGFYDYSFNNLCIILHFGFRGSAFDTHLVNNAR